MKSQASSVTSPFPVPVYSFGFLGQLFEAMPIVIFFKAMQEAFKNTAQSSKTAR